MKHLRKSTCEIIVLKGIFSGGGAFMIALLVGEKLPASEYIIPASNESSAVLARAFDECREGQIP